MVAALSGYDDVDVVSADDVASRTWCPDRVAVREQQFAIVGGALRDGGGLPAIGPRLAEWTCYAARCAPTHGVPTPPSPSSPEGHSPTPHPEAELWLGAHPGDPARLEGDGGERSLLDTITADPEGQLGAATRERFGDALPFLAKVLAADEPLSLQAHPSAEQAMEGFAREDRLGIPISAPTRNYRDREPQARAAGRARSLRGAGGIPSGRTQHRVAARADGGGPRPLRQPAVRPGRRRRAARAVHDLDHRAAGRPRRAGAAGARRRRHLSAFGRNGIRQRRRRPRCELGERYPGDAGVLAAMLLNRISLAAGGGHLPARRQSARLPARRRLRGDGQLRQRAARRSDAQARRRARAAARARLHPDRRIRRCGPRSTREGIEIVYDTPAPEFAVSVLRLDGDRPRPRGRRTRRVTTARRCCCAPRARCRCTRSRVC